MTALLVLLVATNLAWAWFYWRARAWPRFDPAWLIALAEQQCPHEAWLPDALTRCTRAQAERGGQRYYFVPPHRPKRPGFEGRFLRNIVLQHPDYVLVCLDVLHGNVIGGVELLPYDSRRAPHTGAAGGRASASSQ